MNDLQKMFEQLNPSDIQKQRVWEGINEHKSAPRKSRHIGRTLMIAAVISTAAVMLSLGINAASGGKFLEPLENLFLGDIVKTQAIGTTDPDRGTSATKQPASATTEPSETAELTEQATGKNEQITEPKQPTTVSTRIVTQKPELMTEATELPEKTTEPITGSTAPTEKDTETIDPNEVISGDYIYLPLSETTAKIDAYIGSDSKVEIPSEIDGYKIVKLGYASFAFDNKITEVVIPEGITEIDRYAFHMCQNITNVKIPNSVEIIGDNAFRNCSKIVDVKIGTGIKKIGADAFGKSKIITISGYENTVAYIYATNYRINFISLGYA